ncbi:energy-coupling factor transport system ATP-binding protein [Methanomicrobium sp. W14]|uniref:ATP-binding cassette domain-containing protein n=1 Tax=Methanomicrobium sp. W14 TaxID=2817839 RepID=UPI001AE625B8|nr:energy-coupling factor ABC transporter ATP-binding protein [Methanomicrobium sp. W14]MBP2132791.1 energy-coupling factor transport system ATP-binding protein [Methanomicrobium sp. W14]
MPEIVLNNLVIKKGDFVSFSDGVFRSGVHVVTGPVGAGKSTLSMALSGVLKPQNGKISFFGIGSTLLSMQFPEYHLTKLTVENEIKSWGLSPEKVLEAACLQNKMHCDPMNISRGELKRLHLLCVLSKKADLLILDEPFSALDPVWKEKLCTFSFSRSSITVIFTHERSVMPKADYIWKITGGKLRFVGKIPECLHEWDDAPEYIIFALKKGVIPKNIRFSDTVEALCRTQG